MGDELTEVDEIFSAAIELRSPEERAQYVRDACRGDADLALRVQQLVDAYFRAGDFLESPVSVLPETDVSIPENPGAIIGPYKLLQQIGEGGMGVVFMAEQTEPIQRTVALKIIKPGMDTRQVIARFEAERQALAMMDHPNIARVIDAGTTTSGRPYFVMDLVKGVPITEYCDRHQLSVRQRLELMATVCQAVQHAHQKGIIHRDIKPSNVLVAEYDDKPVPKVIDFGVAKATAQKLTERTMFTEFGQVIGTVEYMSPEQAKFNQLDVDTRSDIYSLGVLLYELLAGSTPFERNRLREAALDDVLRIIREEDPPPPSRRLSTSDTLPSIAANRHTEAARLSKEVRGELDWIVMKALEKDRNRRYETANGLIRDIELYLNDRPVQVSPPSAMYRFRKFARRNMVTLTAGALVAIALVLGTIVSTWQAVVATEAREEAVSAKAAAEANFQKAMAAVDEMLTHVSEESLADIPQMEPIRRTLLEKALAFYQEFLLEKSNEPRVRVETGKACERVERIYYLLGQFHQADQVGRQAIATFETLESQFPKEPMYREEAARSYALLGETLRATSNQIDLKELERVYQQALNRYELLAVEFPDEPHYGSALARNYGKLARALSDRGEYKEAESAFNKAIGLHTKLAKRFSAAPGDRVALSDEYNWLASLLGHIGRQQESEQSFRAALEIQRKLAADFPDSGEYRQGFAYNLYSFGRFLEKWGRPQEAEQAYREAIVLQEALVEDYSNRPQNRFQLIDILDALGNMLRRSGRAEEAKAQFARAATVYGPAISYRENQLRKFPHDPSHHIWLIGGHEMVGTLLRDSGQNEDAINSFRSAIAARKRFAAAFPESAVKSYGLAFDHLRIADILNRLNRHEDAVAEYVNAAGFLKQSFSGPLSNPELIAGCNRIIDSLSASMHRRDGDGFDWLTLALLSRLVARNDEAKKSYDQAIRWMETNKTDDERLVQLRDIATGILRTGGSHTVKVPQPTDASSDLSNKKQILEPRTISHK